MFLLTQVCLLLLLANDSTYMYQACIQAVMNSRFM